MKQHTQGSLLLVFAGLAVVAFSIVGCSQAVEGPERYRVTGTVTYEGQPIAHGRIRLDADASAGNVGPSGYAAIKDGKYDTSAEGARSPVAGALRVTITAVGKSDENDEVEKELFPAYITKETLTPGGEATTLDFDVPKGGGASEKK